MVLENILSWGMLGAIILLLVTIVAIVFIKNKRTLAKFGLFVGGYLVGLSLVGTIVAFFSGKDIFSGILILITSAGSSQLGAYSEVTAFGVFFIVGAFILWASLGKLRGKLK